MRKRILILAVLLLVPTMVFAAKDGGITALNVPPGKKVATPTYNFNGKNHNLHIPITEVRKPANPQKTVIASFRHVWYSASPQQKEVVEKNTAAGTFLCVSMPEQTSGNYHYEFAGYSNAFGRKVSYQEYAGFISDQVLLDSY
ncbi:MAG: hypothetical protein OSJ70_09225 [Bacilli bacterium]|mgnify:CR=1 FL=1|nr:hypothetical protein [Bacilli bacterium]